MRLTILGGGGFRVPLVYRALLDDHAEGRVTHVTLYDLDAGRLAAIGRVLAEQAAGYTDAPEVSVTTDLDAAIAKADFVFSAVRVRGLEGRVADERIALDQGVLGQETVGAGGVSQSTSPSASLGRPTSMVAPRFSAPGFRRSRHCM